MNPDQMPDNSQRARADGWAEAGKRLINCDQVAWLLDVVERYLPRDSHPAISRQREMQKYGALYEIMEAANLGFDGKAARHNGTPPDARDAPSAPMNGLVGRHP